LEGEAATLIIGKPGPFSQLLFQDGNLLLEMLNDVLPDAAHPASQRNEEQGEWIH